jgi:Tfp pilus tip-associated adhesin PilY1
MLALTSTFSTVKSTIEAMVANGGTNQTIGLHWGWLSLLRQSPLNAPAEDVNNQYQHVIILFTDGQNTVNRWNGDGSMSTSSTERGKIDTRMETLCAAVKAKNTTIYAVQLDDGTGVSPVLPKCASGSATFFMLTTPSEIDAAFAQIGTSISKLRLELARNRNKVALAGRRVSAKAMSLVQFETCLSDLTTSACPARPEVIASRANRRD